MGLLVTFFLLSIAFSFLCSILEAVLLSITPSYVSRKVNEKSLTGKLLEHYKQDIDRPLSAILTLNTIAHTVGAIGVGAQAGKLFGTHQFQLGFMEMNYESIIAGIMTLAILILSEIIPKTIGANNWRQLTPFTVKIIRILLVILWPLVWVSQLITKSLKKEKGRSVLSRADFAALTTVGHKSGALRDHESTIIKNLLGFEQMVVRDIMTPKTVSFMAEESTSISDFHKQNSPIQFSRIPVYREVRDHITGLVLKDDILQKLTEQPKDVLLKDIIRPVYFVDHEMPLLVLFDTLVKKGHHLSVVVDNFGSVMGLVTMEDLFETLLGFEIVDESDSVEDLQELARKRWEERHRRKIDKNNDQP